MKFDSIPLTIHSLLLILTTWCWLFKQFSFDPISLEFLQTHIFEPLACCVTNCKQDVLRSYLFVFPQGDGQTWNNHTITSGHTNCKCAAGNVVPNATHATLYGSSLSWWAATKLFLRRISFTSFVHFRGTVHQWKYKKWRQIRRNLQWGALL